MPFPARNVQFRRVICALLEQADAIGRKMRRRKLAKAAERREGAGGNDRSILRRCIFDPPRQNGDPDTGLTRDIPQKTALPKIALDEREPELRRFLGREDCANQPRKPAAAAKVEPKSGILLPKRKNLRTVEKMPLPKRVERPGRDKIDRFLPFHERFGKSHEPIPCFT